MYVTLDVRRRIAFVVTHGVTARILLRGQLRFLRQRGFQVSVIAAPGADLDAVREREGVDTFAVPMSRSVRLHEGPLAFGAMVRALRAARPDVVNASTAKGGLLGMLAARVLRVPTRIYMVRGTLVETASGFRRAALYGSERLAVGCSHRVAFVSESLRRFYVEEGLVAPSTPTVVLPSNGIDLSRFRPRRESQAVREATRRRLGIPASAVVVGFVGRLVADKGVADMIAALERVATSGVEAHFLVVGGDLAGDSLDPLLERRLRAVPRTIFIGRTDEPAPYYAAMDVLLFPSHREGLPNVPLEAAACEAPTVGYEVTGVRDAVESGRTGRLVKFGDEAALANALREYLTDAPLRLAHGSAARLRVEERFEQRIVWERWGALYAQESEPRGSRAR